MAKASPFLGRTLAKESIYRTLILFAFFADDEICPVETKLFAPATYRALSFKERLWLQKGVLESRWFTLNRIQQCLPTFKRLAILQDWHIYRHLLIKQADKFLGKCHKAEPQHFQHPASLPNFDESTVFTDFCSSIDSNPSTNDYRICHLDDMRWIIDVQYFPKRLLDPVSWHNINSDTSPADLLTLLFLVSRTDLVWASHMADVPAIVRGLDTAIREQNQQALKLLLNIQLTIFWCGSPAPSERGGGPLRGHLTPETMTKLLHLAIRQGEESSWIVDSLLDVSERRDLVPKNDRVVMKWAIWRLNAVGNEKEGLGWEYRKWLSEY